jgi:hypothetical protein
MPKQIIFIVSHGFSSSNKILTKQIKDFGVDVEYVIALSPRKQNNNEYEANLIKTDQIKLTENQNKLRLLLKSISSSLHLDNIDMYFKEVMAYLANVISDDVQLCLLLDANLGNPGHTQITKLFHGVINGMYDISGQIFANKVKGFFVYSFSEMIDACDSANQYFSGNVQAECKLEVSLSDSYACGKKEISTKMQPFIDAAKDNSNWSKATKWNEKENLVQKHIVTNNNQTTKCSLCNCFFRYFLFTKRLSSPISPEFELDATVSSYTINKKY